MTDDQQAETVVTEEPTKEPVPSSEPAEAKEAVDATVDPETEAELSDGVSDRTKEQFNKLKEANKALKEQLDQKETIEPLFDAMRPKDTNIGVTQGQLDQVTDIDPATGTKYINEEKLNNLLTNTQQQAQRALAQVQEYEDRRQLTEAYQDYPELNPKAGVEKFDKDFFNKTEAILVHSMTRPDQYGGQVLTYKEAAQRARSATKADLAKVEKEADAQQTAKEQGSLEATGRSDRRSQTSTSEDELRQRIRHGDEDALASIFEEA